ncbi:YqaJ viral recombinase family protein [Anoxybacillus kestanbolensis]|uniref:YqaJ viral recombinase family protein n=1 Tax=Anoxybacillus kestanbolensis TaxID=227476 RepID=UPI003D24440C
MFGQKDVNVVQHRDKWVGGSDVPAILGISKYKTQFQLAKEKTGIEPSDFKGNEGNEYTAYGNVLEPQIREYINAINETNFQPATKTDVERGIRSNTDGYDPENQLILEIKTHGKTPDIRSYEAQMQLYMYQFGVEYGWLALYERPDNFDAEFDADRLQIKVVHRDNQYVQHILDAIETFWIRCEYLKEKPDMTEQEFMSVGQNELTIVAQQVEKLELQLASFKKLEEQYKAMKDKLYQLMEEYDVKKWETDRIVITRVLPGKRESFDSARFKKEHPELAQQYIKISQTAGSIRIKLKEAN